MTLIFLLVQMPEMAPLLAAFAGLEGCTIPISGAINQRPDDGFIVLQWDKEVPEAIRQKLDDDPHVIDHIGLNIQTRQEFITLPAW